MYYFLVGENGEIDDAHFDSIEDAVNYIMNNSYMLDEDSYAIYRAGKSWRN